MRGEEPESLRRSVPPRPAPTFPRFSLRRARLGPGLDRPRAREAARQNTFSNSKTEHAEETAPPSFHPASPSSDCLGKLHFRPPRPLQHQQRPERAPRGRATDGSKPAATLARHLASIPLASRCGIVPDFWAPQMILFLKTQPKVSHPPSCLCVHPGAWLSRLSHLFPLHRLRVSACRMCQDSCVVKCHVKP